MEEATEREGCDENATAVDWRQAGLPVHLPGLPPTFIHPGAALTAIAITLPVWADLTTYALET